MGFSAFFPFVPLTLLVILSSSLRILRLMFAAKFLHDTEAVRIAIRFSALKNCGGVGRLLVVGGGGGCCWSPGVPTAGGVGGGCKDCWSLKVACTEGVGGGAGVAGHQVLLMEWTWMGVVHMTGHQEFQVLRE